jgi:RHS repeat-associated protein
MFVTSDPNQVVAATGQASVTGNVFVAKSPELFNYDADGNLTNDGRWTYTWDGENRLTGITSLDTAPPGSKLKLDFAYDAKGRRIQKIVSTWSGLEYVPQSTNNFIYDGWNLIATLNPQSSIIESFMWGNDLSGSMQGAGGVGGLLEVSYHGSTTTNCFPAYDGNGNIAALINAADGTVVANYEYGPFGEVIRVTGPMAKLNPFRFSTKYQDEESDLLYYGYRYYKPSTGTWPNRDPMGEPGFEVLRHGKVNIRGSWSNLYGFTLNDSVDQYDLLGLDCPGCDAVTGAYSFLQQAISIKYGISIGPNLLTTSCALRACAQHDECYCENGCSMFSWGTTIAKIIVEVATGIPASYNACEACNVYAVQDMYACATGKDNNEGEPMYFCAKQARFINIGPGPGFDFPTLGAARCACCGSCK